MSNPDSTPRPEVPVKDGSTDASGQQTLRAGSGFMSSDQRNSGSVHPTGGSANEHGGSSGGQHPAASIKQPHAQPPPQRHGHRPPGHQPGGLQFGTVQSGSGQVIPPARTSSAPPSDHPDPTRVYARFKGGGYQMPQPPSGYLFHQGQTMPPPQQSSFGGHSSAMNPDAPQFQVPTSGRGGRSSHRGGSSMRTNGGRSHHSGGGYLPRHPQQVHSGGNYYHSQMQPCGGYSIPQMHNQHGGMHSMYMRGGMMSMQPPQQHHQQRAQQPGPREKAPLLILHPVTKQQVVPGRKEVEKVSSPATTPTSAPAPSEEPPSLSLTPPVTASPTVPTTSGDHTTLTPTTVPAVKSKLSAKSPMFKPAVPPVPAPIPAQFQATNGVTADTSSSLTTDRSIAKAPPVQPSSSGVMMFGDMSVPTDTSPEKTKPPAPVLPPQPSVLHPTTSTVPVVATEQIPPLTPEKVEVVETSEMKAPVRNSPPKEASTADTEKFDSEKDREISDGEEEEWEEGCKTVKIVDSDPQSSASINRAVGKLIYTALQLSSLRSKYQDLPKNPREKAKWRCMDLIVDESNTRGSVRGPRGGNGGGPGTFDWSRSAQQASLKSGSRASSGGGGDKTWARGTELPRQRRDRGGDRGGRGTRPDPPLFDGPVKPLEKGDNRWIPQKSTTRLQATIKSVQSILNKMTREKFDRLAKRLSDTEMESLEILRGVITLIFDKSLSEPNFCDMYADLCYFLQEHWESWSFLKTTQNDDDKKWYWTTLSERDTEVIGPFKGIDELIASATGVGQVAPIPTPGDIKLKELRINSSILIKVWETHDGALYWSGQSCADLPADNRVNGPFDTQERAMSQATKSTSFKRILLNNCQEEFEREGVMEELDEKIKEVSEDLSLDEDARSMQIVELQTERTKAKRRMLGNIRFIGELYKKTLLMERIMHQCIFKLLNHHLPDKASRLKVTNPNGEYDEENIEAMCKLLTTIGKTIDLNNPDMMDLYFETLRKLAVDKKLCLRIRFMIRDVMELRQFNWQPRRNELTQKTLEEIRTDAKKEEAQGLRSQVGTRGGPRADASRGPPMLDRRNPSSAMRSDRSGLQKGSMPQVYSQQRGDIRSSRLAPGSRFGDSSRFGERSSSRGSANRDDNVQLNRRPVTFGSGPRRGDDERGHVRRGVGADPTRMARPSSRGALGGSGSSSGLERRATIPSEFPHQESNEMLRKELEKKAKNVVKEYIRLNDLQEAMDRLNVDIPSAVRPIVVTTCISVGIDGRDNDRLRTAKLLVDLFAQGYLSRSDIDNGFAEYLICLDDEVVDCPNADMYVAYYLSQLAIAGLCCLDWFASGCPPLDKDVWEELQGKKLAERVFAHALKQVVKDSGAASQAIVDNTFANATNVLPRDQRSFRDIARFVQQYQLETVLPILPACEAAEMLVATEDSGKVLQWLEDNVSAELRAQPQFVKQMCLFAVEHQDGAQILRKLVQSTDLQIVCLYGVQQQFEGGDKVKTIFDQLHNQKIISLEAFLKWRDDASAPMLGRQRALESVRDLIRQWEGVSGGRRS